jgi:integrase
MELFHGANPAATMGENLFPENKRERFIEPDEMAQFYAALQKEPSRDLRDFVILSLWTSARRGDILAMRWEDLNLEDNKWAVPDPKNEPYDVALVPEAITVLKRRMNGGTNSRWVFPSPSSASGHLINLNKRWKALLGRANLKKPLHIHDLRRTRPSWMAAQGVSLQIIGKSLGHASIEATQIYSRLHLDPVREAVNNATQAMLAASRKKVKQLPAAPRA